MEKQSVDRQVSSVRRKLFDEIEKIDQRYLFGIENVTRFIKIDVAFLVFGREVKQFPDVALTMFFEGRSADFLTNSNGFGVSTLVNQGERQLFVRKRSIPDFTDFDENLSDDKRNEVNIDSLRKAEASAYLFQFFGTIVAQKFPNDWEKSDEMIPLGEDLFDAFKSFQRTAILERLANDERKNDRRRFNVFVDQQFLHEFVELVEFQVLKGVNEKISNTAVHVIGNGVESAQRIDQFDGFLVIFFPNEKTNDADAFVRI